MLHELVLITITVINVISTMTADKRINVKLVEPVLMVVELGGVIAL